MASSAGWPFRNGGFRGFDLGVLGGPRQKHVRRCDPSDTSDVLQSPSYDPKQAYASAYLQAGLGHAGVAFVGDVIAQRVEGRWGTKIRDPPRQEREILEFLVGGEWAEKWAAWRARGVAERRRRRREEKERRAQEVEAGSDDEGGTPVKPPLADVSKSGLESGPTSLVDRGVVESSFSPQGGPGEQGMEGCVGNSEGVLSFVHSAFKGFLNLSPLAKNQTENASSGAGGTSENRARPAGPSQELRSRPRHDPDDPPGYSLLRSLRMASFAFFVDHPLTNFWMQSIRYNPRNDPTEKAVVKLVLTEAVLTPARIVLLFTWDSLLQRKPKRILRKLRTDFRPAVVRSLQVAAFENVAFYGLSKEIRLREEVVYAAVGLPVSLYMNYFQSTVTAR